MNWVFIGAGNMASSLIGGLINSGANPSSIIVVDPDTDACERAQTRFGIQSASDLDEPISQIADQPYGVVLAVKPHIVETACLSLTKSVDLANQTPPLVVSVAAGVRASSMQQWLHPNSPIVRCMPNTPALLGLGATALFANEACTAQEKSMAEHLLNSAGMTIWVAEEAALDAVTAVSGSGPAYFFYLIEHMAAAGEALGLDELTARDLAIETAFGAASMARAKENTPAVLRENVTSKGGTTAAALNVFNEHQMPMIIEKAMRAAHDRAVEFGDQLAPDAE
jgi:pyrroline-5-carboxylate reductase